MIAFVSRSSALAPRALNRIASRAIPTALKALRQPHLQAPPTLRICLEKSQLRLLADLKGSVSHHPYLEEHGVLADLAGAFGGFSADLDTIAKRVRLALEVLRLPPLVEEVVATDLAKALRRD